MGPIPLPVTTLIVEERLHVQRPQVTLRAQERLQVGAGKELPQQCLVLLTGVLKVILHTAKVATLSPAGPWHPGTVLVARASLQEPARQEGQPNPFILTAWHLSQYTAASARTGCETPATDVPTGFRWRVKDTQLAIL